MTSCPQFLLGFFVTLSLADSVRISRQNVSHLPDMETKTLVGGPGDIFSRYSITGEGVQVYVFGTGIDWTKSEFGGRASGYMEALPEGPIKPCTSSDDSCGMDFDGAGTHAAGLVAGSFLGLATNARVSAVKIVRKEGDKPKWKEVERAMVYIRDNHPEGTPAVILINLESLDCPSSRGCQATTTKRIQELTNVGISVVSPAGAQNSGDCGWPDKHNRAITVGGTTRELEKAAYSNYGSCVDLWAPSDDVMAQHIEISDDVRQWDYKSTSVMDNAAALVAGAAALALEISPDMNYSQLQSFLQSHSKKGVLANLPSGSRNEFLDISFAEFGVIAIDPV